MEQLIQSLLDKQWDSLEARDNGVKDVRIQLGKAFEDIARSRLNDVNSLDEQNRTYEKEVNKRQKALLKRQELKTKLNEEMPTELTAELSTLVPEIDNLDKEIARLVSKRTELASRRQVIESTIASRMAIYKDAIADLDSEFPLETQRNTEDIKRTINENKTKLGQLTTEMIASQEGKVLWDNVCEELDDLDEQVKGFKRSQLHQIAFVLTRACDNIEKSLETASREGWSALVIAIGHELQILHETLSAIQKAES